jgi:hypothetical protein
LSVPGCWVLILCRHAEAEESCRARTTGDLCATLTPIHPANPARLARPSGMALISACCRVQCARKFSCGGSQPLHQMEIPFKAPFRRSSQVLRGETGKQMTIAMAAKRLEARIAKTLMLGLIVQA